MSDEKQRDVKFFYAPVANVTVGKKLLIKGRGEGIVRGILLDSYRYLTEEGQTAHIDNVLRVCVQFYDDVDGACLIPFAPTQFMLARGWGTYMPRGPKENPWQALM